MSTVNNEFHEIWFIPVFYLQWVQLILLTGSVPSLPGKDFLRELHF